MSLFIKVNDFKELTQYAFENFHDSYINFDRQEWRFTQLTSEERDVEINYLFQFDFAENSDLIEIFHNGMEKEFIQNNILNVILSEFPNYNYYFD